MIFRYILIPFFLFSFSLLASPKIYSSVSKHVYSDMKAIQSLSRIKVMKEKHSDFIAYIKRANKEKKIGYWLDKNKLDPSSKVKSRTYLTSIRYLSHQNKILAEFIKNITMDIIYMDKPRSFKAVIKSRHRIFYQDRELKHAIKKYKSKLHQRDIRRAKLKADRNEQKQIAKTKSYRGSKNLNGVWIQEDAILTVFTFKENKLQIKYTGKNVNHKVLGTYEIEDEVLQFTITTIIKFDKTGTGHKRKTKIKKAYKVLKINNYRLILELNKDEIFTLKKRQ